MRDANAIPVIDLGPCLAGEPGALDHAAAELRHALTEIGFYTIVNHGMPSALVHEVYRQIARFHARPLDEKLKIKLDKHNVGYLPMMGGHPDLDNRNRQLGVLRLTDATIAQSFSKN